MILCGHRDKATQNSLHDEGLTQVHWPNSKHNETPSMAVDMAPYPLDWKDTKRFYFLAGLMFATADQLGFKIRWGGDWSMDMDFEDQKFNDLVHFELIDS